MKRNKILLLFLFLALTTQAPAQTDSRNRTPETVVADGLAQLPRKANKDFARLMSEFAATGEQGVAIIAGMLKPAAEGKNATFEYALSGLTDYVTTKDGSRYADGVRRGLAKALATQTDNANRQFLLQLLTKVATAADVPQIAALASDSRLADAAVSSLASVHGIDAEVTALLDGTALSHGQLAKLAGMRHLTAATPKLTAWLATDNDAATRAAIMNALADCGGTTAVTALAAEAKKAAYKPEATGAVESWLRALEATPEATKQQAVAAKLLAKSAVPAYRCAALRLQMMSAGDKAQAVVLKALADADPQYRVTALDRAAEYCGQGIFKAVAARFDKLPSQAKAEVVRWLGDNHAADGTAVVTRCIGGADAALAAEAMTAAAKIGGTECLTSLVAQVGGDRSTDASRALLFFNGDAAQTRQAVTTLLGSGNAACQKATLALVAQRRMTAAYGEVKRLTQSADTGVRAAAYTALQGIVTTAQFDDVCSMLEKASGDDVATLQKAAAAAISSESGDRQYQMATKAAKASSKPQLYYPLMAQSGTSEAIATLISAGNDDATAALLTLDNPEMLPNLLKLAAGRPELKEKFLARYLQLASKAGATAEERYLLLNNGLTAGPSAALASKYITAMGQTHTVQALAAVAPYADAAATKAAAAGAVKEIVAHNTTANSGDAVGALLAKSKAYYESQRATNADAGYAVDEISGLQAKTAAGSVTLLPGTVSVEPGKASAVARDAENFEMAFDYNTAQPLTLVVRSMPLLELDAAKGARLAGSDWKELPTAADAMGYATAAVRVVDDRLFLTVNGKAVMSNAVMQNPVQGKSINAEGSVAVKAGTQAVELRNVCFRQLPSTPVYQLPADEARQGFELLFDGRSLDKWQGNTTNYTPQDGYIYVTAQYGGSGNLYTKKKYSDFVYRFEFCFDQPGVNNGIGIRTHIGTDAAYDGMEIQVLDHDDPIYKGLHDYQQHGSVYGIIVPKHVKFGKLGTWNTEEIRAVGDHITVTVNGEVILDGDIRKACQGHNVAPDGSSHNPYTVDKKNHPGLFNRDGYVSFCGHGPGVKFRNVRILDLSKGAKNAKKKK